MFGRSSRLNVDAIQDIDSRLKMRIIWRRQRFIIIIVVMIVMVIVMFVDDVIDNNDLVDLMLFIIRLQMRRWQWSAIRFDIAMMFVMRICRWWQWFVVIVVFVGLFFIVDDWSARRGLEEWRARGACESWIIVIIESSEPNATELAFETLGMKRAPLGLDVTGAGIDAALASAALGVWRTINMHKTPIAELQVLTVEQLATHGASRHAVGAESHVVDDLV
jgi:hypothetical protein